MKIIAAICSIVIGGCMFNYNSVLPPDNSSDKTTVSVNEVVMRDIPWAAPPLENTLSEDKILERVNNQKTMEELITKSYPEDVLLRYEDPNICISNIDAECSIECLRQVSENIYYVVFKSNENGILYLLFEKSQLDGYLRTTSYWYVKKPLNSTDFKDIIISETTENDVKNIDPYGYYIIDIAGFVSYVSDKLYVSEHLTNDGRLIIIEYEWSDELKQPVVSKVNIVEPYENALNKILLTMDKPI